MKNKQPAGFEPGIYFHMPDDDYHNDSALSHGGIVSLLDSWYDYWIKSPLNPDRKFKASDAMIFGTRCHELLMDEKGFFKKYSVTGSGWERGKILINRTEFQRIKDSIDEIRRVPKAADYFTNGFPEVTIIWIDPATGIRLRIRIDFLRIFGGIDYKRAKSLQNNQLGWHIVDFGYDIQQALYQRGIMHAKVGLRNSTFKVHGAHDMLWIKKFMDNDKSLFQFLFQRSQEPFIFKFKHFNSVIIDNATAHINDAIGIYKRSIETFGTGRPPGGDAVSEEITEYHLPRRIIDRGDHHYE